jgi:hypothetical protein
MAVVPAYAKASMQTTLLAIQSTELFVRHKQITNEIWVELENYLHQGQIVIMLLLQYASKCCSHLATKSIKYLLPKLSSCHHAGADDFFPSRGRAQRGVHNRNEAHVLKKIFENICCFVHLLCANNICYVPKQ